MQHWLTILTLLASLATIFALILSQDFLNFSRKAIASKGSKYSLLVLVTVATTYVALERPNWFINTINPPPQWPPLQGIAQDIAQNNRNLRCGINGYLEGFSLLRDGQAEGFDVDFCRAVSVAISGNDSAVDFELLSDAERFKKVEDGAVDVMFRNTSWTIGRDLGLEVDFGPTIFYDEQGILVPKDSGIKTIQDLRDKKICVLKTTTSRENIEKYVVSKDINPLPLIVTKSDGDQDFDDNGEVFRVYGDQGSGICDAVTSDLSQIAIYRNRLDDPDAHVTIQNLNISQELLSPVYVEGDEHWANIINCVVYATIHAAELGITSDNVSELANSDNHAIKQFLGLTDNGSTNIGEALGIERDFAFQIIKAVGNYDEIYERNFGDRISKRGRSALWQQDGLLISPPFTLPEA